MPTVIMTGFTEEQDSPKSGYHIKKNSSNSVYADYIPNSLLSYLENCNAISLHIMDLPIPGALSMRSKNGFQLRNEYITTFVTIDVVIATSM